MDTQFTVISIHSHRHRHNRMIAEFSRYDTMSSVYSSFDITLYVFSFRWDVDFAHFSFSTHSYAINSRKRKKKYQQTSKHCNQPANNAVKIVVFFWNGVLVFMVSLSPFLFLYVSLFFVTCSFYSLQHKSIRNRVSWSNDENA